MKKILAFFTISILFNSCITDKKALNSFESETLKITQVTDNIFMHISYLQTNDYGKVACNGMIYVNTDEAIVFDTPIDDKTSKELINWIEKVQKKKIKAVVITHFHTDCLGGLREFHKNGTRSYASNKTIELVKQNNLEVLPEIGFENKIEINVGDKPVFAQFFGEGHTSDNVVGYIPSEKALFGGCLIKSVNASKGYLGDANVAHWSETVRTIKRELPDLEIVIPGHGKNGGTELLDYTASLFMEN